MIIPSSKYVGQIDTSDANFPYGKAQNEGTPSDGAGTPLDKDWVNDVFGMRQKLVVEAGITPSGNPDSAANSDVRDAMRKLFFDVLPYEQRDTEKTAYTIIPPLKFRQLSLEDTKWKPSGSALQNLIVDGLESDGIIAEVRMPVGTTLVSAAAIFKGPAHSTNWPPAVYAGMVISRVAVEDGQKDTVWSQSPTPVSQAIYEARNAMITGTLVNNTIQQWDEYFEFSFHPEDGTYALPGTLFYGIMLTVSLDRGMPF